MEVAVELFVAVLKEQQFSGSVVQTGAGKESV